MKQAKASVKEAETLLRWLQNQESPPPFNRTVCGYLLLLENCCDPGKDYLDWKPGQSPADNAAHLARIAALERALEETTTIAQNAVAGVAEAGRWGVDHVGAANYRERQAEAMDNIEKAEEEHRTAINQARLALAPAAGKQ